MILSSAFKFAFGAAKRSAINVLLKGLKCTPLKFFLVSVKIRHIAFCSFHGFFKSSRFFCFRKELLYFIWRDFKANIWFLRNCSHIIKCLFRNIFVLFYRIPLSNFSFPHLYILFNKSLAFCSHLFSIRDRRTHNLLKNC